MAQTRGPYTEVDDDECDAESPYTASFCIRRRDQWFAALCVDATAAPDTDRLSLPGRAKTTNTQVTAVLKPDGSGGVEWGTIAPPLGILPWSYVRANAYSHNNTVSDVDSDWSFAIANIVDKVSRFHPLQGYAGAKGVSTIFAHAKREAALGSASTGTDSWGNSCSVPAGVVTNHAFDNQAPDGGVSFFRGCTIVLGGGHDDGDPYVTGALGIHSVEIIEVTAGVWEARFYGNWSKSEDGGTAVYTNFPVSTNGDGNLLFTLSTADSAYTQKMIVANSKGSGELLGHLSISGDNLFANLRAKAKATASANDYSDAGVWWQSFLESEA